MDNFLTVLGSITDLDAAEPSKKRKFSLLISLFFFFFNKEQYVLR